MAKKEACARQVYRHDTLGCEVVFISVVTGGSRGIAEPVVDWLARAGAHVVVNFCE